MTTQMGLISENPTTDDLIDFLKDTSSNLKEFRDYTKNIFSNFRKIQTIDIANEMTYPDQDGNNSDGTSVPPELSGLFWMDDNPVPEYVLSFGKSDYQTVADGYTCVNDVMVHKESGKEIQCTGGMRSLSYDSDIWSWQDSLFGRVYHTTNLAQKLEALIECGGDEDGKITFCRIYGISVRPFDGTTDAEPELASLDSVEWTMTRVDDDTWLRTSYMFTEKPLYYHFKRVVNGDGSHTSHWDNFMSEGRDKGPSQNDVFGYGADSRKSVSHVPKTMLLAKKV